jgi:hypothetical protein
VFGIPWPWTVSADDGGIPLIEPPSLRHSGLDLDQAVLIPHRGIPKHAYVQPNDILMARSLAERSLVLLNRHDQPAVLAESVLAVRPTQNDVPPEFLVEYLSSPTARKLLKSQASFGADGHSLQLTAAALETLPVPIIDPEHMQAVKQLQEVEHAVRAKADEMQATRRRIFDSANKRDLVTQLDRLKSRGRLLIANLQTLESLDHQIAALYPLPIAFRYRLLASASDPDDLYREQFRFAENLLAFLGSLSLAVLQPQDRPMAAAKLDHGMTVGKWRDVVEEAARALRSYADNPLALAIGRLNIATKHKGFGADVEKIINARNEWAHPGEGPELTDDIAEASSVQRDRIAHCLEALSFLPDFPIRRIRLVDHGRSGDWRFKCSVYRGDNAGLPQEDILFRSELPEGELMGDLFVDLGKERWVSLFPVITVQKCTRCRSLETFYVDSWDRRRGSAGLKSFERGHAASDPEVTARLEDWNPEPLTNSKA